MRHILSTSIFCRRRQYNFYVDVHGIYCRQSAEQTIKFRDEDDDSDDDDDDDDDDDHHHHHHHRNMLGLIFVEVESSMQLLSEIYGYLFEHVKRTCMTLSDPGIYTELCTFLEHTEESGPSLFCLYSLSELRYEWGENSRTHSYTFTHLRTHTHSHTLKL